MKKFTSILLVLLLALGLVGCSSSTGSTDSTGTDTTTTSGSETTATEDNTTTETVKVGIARNQEGETWEIVKNYLDSEVGPALGMEFVYSEKLNDANGLVDFMNQMYAQDCKGIINFVTDNDAVTQGATLAESLGMYFVTENSALNEEVAGLEHNLGHCGASAPGIGEAYKTIVEGLTNDGEPHSIFMATGGAVGQVAASHYYSAQGMLEAMQEVYGLNYTKSIDEILNTQDPGEVEHDNPDIHIYLYPGFTDMEGLLNGAQTQLQTGNYDMFATVFSYSSFAQIIDDCEKALNKNIRVFTTTSIETQTSTGFSSTDSTGDTVLNAAIINPLTVQTAMCAVLLWHGINGNGAAVKDESGNAILYHCLPWAISGAEVYEEAAKLDLSHDTYVLNSDDLKALCTSDVTYKDIEAKLVECGDIEAIVAAKLG